MHHESTCSNRKVDSQTRKNVEHYNNLVQITVAPNYYSKALHFTTDFNPTMLLRILGNSMTISY